MKLIREIIISLVLLVVFMVLSFFSIEEYTEEKINLNSQEDKLPGVSLVLSAFSSFLSLSNKIPVPQFLSLAKTEMNYNTEMAQDIYNNANLIVKDKTNTKEEKLEELEIIIPEKIKKPNWSELFREIKGALSKDWSRP